MQFGREIKRHQRLGRAQRAGVSVASPVPFQLKSVGLAGAYDQHGRGRGSNLLNGFNLLNTCLEVDNHRLEARDAHHVQQVLDV